jgi:N-acetylglucosaminyl-diphospho-decaprenol L-rhamnosyltransferase
MQKHGSSKQVSIVIVTHNSAGVIEKCLGSVPAGIKVYFVDNDSSDGTVDLVNKSSTKAILINSKNIGFGRANNLALEKVKTEYALLLNPDTILQPDSIEKLLDAADKYPESAIIAPMLYHEDGRLQQSYKTTVFSREKNKTKYIEPEGDLCAECLSGAVMLLRLSCFKKIGFFDPEIFLFYEDDDLCLKARGAGYSLVLTPQAKITHLMGRSSPPSLKYIYLKNRHMMWSRLYLEKKYNGAFCSKLLAVQSLYLSVFKAFVYLLTFNQDKAAKYLSKSSGAFAFLLGMSAI